MSGVTRPVQCGNCDRTLPVEIPIGITGDFYCCEKCRKEVCDPPKKNEGPPGTGVVAGGR